MPVERFVCFAGQNALLCGEDLWLCMCGCVCVAVHAWLYMCGFDKIIIITSCDTRALHVSPVLSIPLQAHHKAQSSENFLSFLVKNLKSCNFLSFGQSCWNCMFKFPRLRAFERRTACPIAAKKIYIVHTFLWMVAGHCLRAGIIESHHFFVLRCILVKFHIRTRLIGSFPSTYWSWSCAERKLHVTPVHTSPYANWSVTKGCFHHFR